MILTHFLLARNIPLSSWKRLSKEDLAREDFFRSYKEISEEARLIVNACANMDAVDLIAKEWDQFDSQLRMAICFEANGARGTKSNNKTKGLQRLDELINGRLLKKIDDRRTERVTRSIAGKTLVEDRPVDPAVSGAMTEFAGYALPANYKELKPSEKRKIRQKLADERRNQK